MMDKHQRHRKRTKLRAALKLVDKIMLLRVRQLRSLEDLKVALLREVLRYLD